MSPWQAKARSPSTAPANSREAGKLGNIIAAVVPPGEWRGSNGGGLGQALAIPAPKSNIARLHEPTFMRAYLRTCRSQRRIPGQCRMLTRSPRERARPGKDKIRVNRIAAGKSSASFRMLLLQEAAEAALLELELAQQGFAPRTRRVESGSELQSAIEEESWDLVLCDPGLPWLDPLSALTILKEHGLDLVFIIVSSAIPESLAIEVMRAGAHDCLSKSGLGRLGAVIERELREAAIRAERRRLQHQLLLSDRLVSVGTLAAGVAHEINNPLAFVVGNLEFALSRLASLNARTGGAAEIAEVIQALKQARDGSERIRVTTSDLKVFCPSNDETKTTVDVRRVMESSINMAWNEIRVKGRLKRNFEAVPNIDGNESRLGQLFMNLLVNAAQALPEERIDENEILVGIRPHASGVVIEVQNTGDGMSAAQMKRVFEPFFTLQPRGIGTGLGLSICQSIVAELGGEICVESPAGVGTLFRVVLPARAASISVQPPASEKPAPWRARILVIDDEAMLCQVIRRLLMPQYEVHTLVDAREALELLTRDSAFDVIFCDLMMPLMSGMEFFGELLRLTPDLAPRTVFLTGGAFNSQARQFLSGVPNLLVEKPFDSQALLNAIARVSGANLHSGTWATGEARRSDETMTQKRRTQS
jgi:signal transduction histidine kinase/ActR/RegA family two-component response regulator